MDIDGVTGRIHPTKFAGQAKAKSDNTFAQILDRATDAVHPEAEPKDAPCSVTQVARAASCKVSPVDRQTLQHASKVLDVLEEYNTGTGKFTAAYTGYYMVSSSA